MAKPRTIGRDEAERLAVEALGFIAADPVLLPRFLAVTGIGASEIRRAAREPGFLAGVLQFILAHEPTLTQFAQATGADPAALRHAANALPFGDEGSERSI